ncbi:hypothetical protein [Chryseolinea soli]|uniref:Uncharacterized protein n=1 Tax=Chryseolinea soli TaxID=2321403 RepID=A0A385SPP2_9BACT|nr:hypothetical protein [Chryseolinea soli]AYB32506.1 hypothetical protein D4L85_18845 [Chryseolinea soli]
MKTKIIYWKVPIDPARERIRLNEVAWYCEEDSGEEEAMEVAVTRLRNLDRAKFRAMIKTITFREVPADFTRKRIYLNEVAWYYEDDPRGKEELEAMLAILKNIDFSKLEEKNKKAS